MTRVKQAIIILTLILIGLFSATLDGKADSSAIDKAMNLLDEGNQRYIEGKFSETYWSEARRLDMAKGQKPFAVVVACSDSRVPVERIFDRGIGDIFVVRVAGNVCRTDEIASIEYAIEHLNVPLVVILGHTNCGAVTAALEPDLPEGNLGKLLSAIVPAAKRAKKEKPHLEGDELINEAVRLNVWQAMGDLMSESEPVRDYVTDKRIGLVGGVYNLSTGRVEWLKVDSLQPQN